MPTHKEIEAKFHAFQQARDRYYVHLISEAASIYARLCQRLEVGPAEWFDDSGVGRPLVMLGVRGGEGKFEQVGPTGLRINEAKKNVDFCVMLVLSNHSDLTPNTDAIIDVSVRRDRNALNVTVASAAPEFSVAVSGEPDRFDGICDAIGIKIMGKFNAEEFPAPPTPRVLP